MSEKERGEIMEALGTLPENAKQFVLGYAAGRTAALETKKDPDEEKEKEQETA